MAKPLTITSPSNSHALAAYLAMAVLGGYFTFTEPQVATLVQYGNDIATALMGALMFAGVVALSATIMASRRRDPSVAMTVEIIALLVLTLVLYLFMTAAIRHYGYDAPTVIVFAGAYCGGCVGRLVQAGSELFLLVRARRGNRRTAEVMAKPEKE